MKKLERYCSVYMQVESKVSIFVVPCPLHINVNLFNKNSTEICSTRSGNDE